MHPTNAIDAIMNDSVFENSDASPDTKKKAAGAAHVVKVGEQQHASSTSFASRLKAGAGAVKTRLFAPKSSKGTSAELPPSADTNDAVNTASVVVNIILPHSTSASTALPSTTTSKKPHDKPAILEQLRDSGAIAETRIANAEDDHEVVWGPHGGGPPGQEEDNDKPSCIFREIFAVEEDDHYIYNTNAEPRIQHANNPSSNLQLQHAPKGKTGGAGASSSSSSTTTSFATRRQLLKDALKRRANAWKTSYQKLDQKFGSTSNRDHRDHAMAVDRGTPSSKLQLPATCSTSTIKTSTSCTTSTNTTSVPGEEAFLRRAPLTRAPALVGKVFLEDLGNKIGSKISNTRNKIMNGVTGNGANGSILTRNAPPASSSSSMLQNVVPPWKTLKGKKYSKMTTIPDEGIEEEPSNHGHHTKSKNTSSSASHHPSFLSSLSSAIEGENDSSDSTTTTSSANENSNKAEDVLRNNRSPRRRRFFRRNRDATLVPEFPSADFFNVAEGNRRRKQIVSMRSKNSTMGTSGSSNSSCNTTNVRAGGHSSNKMQKKMNNINDHYDGNEISGNGKSLISAERNFTLTQALHTVDFWVFATTNGVSGGCLASVFIHLDSIFYPFRDSLSAFYATMSLSASIAAVLAAYSNDRGVFSFQALCLFHNGFMTLAYFGMTLLLKMYFDDIDLDLEGNANVPVRPPSAGENQSKNMHLSRERHHHIANDLILEKEAHGPTAVTTTTENTTSLSPDLQTLMLCVIAILLGTSAGLTMIIQGASYATAFGREHNGNISAVAKSLMVLHSALFPSILSWLHDYFEKNYVYALSCVAIYPIFAFGGSLYALLVREG
ncbi:unnamed protein product [Amoebophrya sp. A25]|nr:unnamed protein product [Amoebophrya sp. A25]|eukprot:GSA25T00017839001.1